MNWRGKWINRESAQCRVRIIAPATRSAWRALKIEWREMIGPINADRAAIT
jgi:hypothetical protein